MTKVVTKFGHKTLESRASRFYVDILCFKMKHTEFGEEYTAHELERALRICENTLEVKRACEDERKREWSRIVQSSTASYRPADYRQGRAQSVW